MKKLNPIRAIFAMGIIAMSYIMPASAQEVLTNQSISSMTAAKISASIITTKIKSSANTFKLAPADIIQLRTDKVSDPVIEEMLLASSDLPDMKNEDVIAMQNGKVSKRIILKKINLSPCRFNTSSESLIALKSAGVPDDVIKIMMDPASSVSAASDLVSKIPDPHPQSLPAPKSLPQSGIFYEAYSPKTEYQQLEPTTTNQKKTGGFGEAVANHYTLGISGQSTRVGLSNNTANMVIVDSRPVFYFYVERDGKSIDEVAESTMDGIASPNDFVLVRAKVTKTGREVEIAHSNNYGSESGFAKGTIPFRYKKVTDRLYKVYFENDVPAGQYAFYYNKGSEQRSSLKLYDFALRNNVSVTK